MADFSVLSNQIDSERKLVSFDSYDLTVRQILDMYESGEIFVPPEYQRQFVWNESRQSELIESVFLGIPIPNLFLASNKDSTWEVVDGVQRLSSIAHFVGAEGLLNKILRETPLKAAGLRKLVAMNGFSYGDLPRSMQLLFLTRPLRLTVLNDKSDLEVRYDLFERLNTGGVSLTNQEIRNCVFRGPFNESIKRLAESRDFIDVVKLKPVDATNGTKEEMVLRFFAFFYNYKKFDHSVEGFLNDYMKSNVASPISLKDHVLFGNTFRILKENMPNGVVRGARSVTPVNLFEAISVGLALALMENGVLDDRKLKNLPDIAADDDLRKLATGATNSRKRVVGRIEFVRDALV